MGGLKVNQPKIFKSASQAFKKFELVGTKAEQ